VGLRFSKCTGGSVDFLLPAPRAGAGAPTPGPLVFGQNKNPAKTQKATRFLSGPRFFGEYFPGNLTDLKAVCGAAPWAVGLETDQEWPPRELHWMPVTGDPPRPRTACPLRIT
jgi:hypothetical protein